MSLRDTQVIHLELSHDIVRARIGLHEEHLCSCTARTTNRAPLTLCVGSRNHSLASACLKSSPSRILSASDYLDGPQLDEAPAVSQDVPISWPFVGAQISDWARAEAIWRASFLFSHPSIALRVLQPGNARSLPPPVSSSPKWNLLSSYPSSPVYPCLPANASVKCSSNVSTLLDSPSLNDPWPRRTTPMP